MFNFVLRLVVTLVLFAVTTKVTKVTPLLCIGAIGSLLVLDSIDCGLYKIIITNSYDCKTHSYQKYDKIVDLASYIVFLVYFKNQFDSVTMNILIGLLVWRAIGVVKFYYTNQNKHLHNYMDAFKEIALLAVLMPNYNIVHVCIVVFLKQLYEKYHHTQIYK